jgi:adenylate cyclase
LLVFTGRTAEGRQAFAEFERLSPRDGNMVAAHRVIAASHYIDKNYEKCVEAAQRQLSARPDITVTYRRLAAALGQLGRTDEARVALAKAFDPSSPEPALYGRNRGHWMRPEDHEHLLQGLRKAGWQG